MKAFKSTAFDSLLYLLVYVIIQYVVSAIFMLIFKDEQSSMRQLLTLSTASVATILVFWLSKWTPIHPHYLRERHWDALIWALIMPIGLLFPLNALQDVLAMSTSRAMEEAMRMLMESQWSIVIVGFVVPIAEEMVFRGAILRRLLKYADSRSGRDQKLKQRYSIGAVVVSALVFGLIHINPAQIVNATLMGLLLGYVYMRTDSILPCVVLHCANNVIICLIEYVLPGIDYMSMMQLAGSYTRLALYLFFSLCVFVPALVQFHKASQR